MLLDPALTAPEEHAEEVYLGALKCSNAMLMF